MNDLSITCEIDATRLFCPMPVIKLQNKIKSLSPHDIVCIRCSDPGTEHDIPTWCRLFGHTLLKTLTTDDELIFWVQVGMIS